MKKKKKKRKKKSAARWAAEQSSSSNPSQAGLARRAGGNPEKEKNREPSRLQVVIKVYSGWMVDLRCRVTREKGLSHSSPLGCALTATVVPLCLFYTSRWGSRPFAKHPPWPPLLCPSSVVISDSSACNIWQTLSQSLIVSNLYRTIAP